MKLTRRQALKLGFIGSSSLFLPSSLAIGAETAKKKDCCQDYQLPVDQANFEAPQFSQVEVPYFEAPFKPLSLLNPVTKYEGGRFEYDRPIDFYEIKMQKTPINIIPGKPTEVWSYNGEFPGPLIRQRGGYREQDQGRTSCIRFINELGKTTYVDEQEEEIYTSVHLHGMASLPQYDGYAEDLIPPGYYKDYYYPNDRAATIWYHDHAIDRTARNVSMGLLGMYIVEDAQERSFNLPSGPYDVPLILQDIRLDHQAQIVFNDRGQRSAYGDIPLVNGVPWPVMQVDARKYRFRILNASASRTYQLMLSQDPQRQTFDIPMAVIATDCGLLQHPVLRMPTLASPFQALPISPAERYEIVIDFSAYPGQTLYLRSPMYASNIDSDDRIQVLMKFEVGDPCPDTSTLPDRMRDFEPLLEKAAKLGIPVKTRTFRFERTATQWLINNKRWNRHRVDANPEPNTIEVWNLVNTGGGWIHPVHIHFVDSQVISRNGQAPPNYERGWKDVFRLEEFETVQIVAEFGRRGKDLPANQKDVRGKFMMHCHNLVHEDHAMMTQFEIGEGGVDPCCEKAKPIAEMKPLGPKATD